MKPSRLCCLLSAAVLGIPLCARAEPPMFVSSSAAETPSPAPTPAEPQVLVGSVTREQIEAACPEWVRSEVEAAPDDTAAKGLAAVEPGAEVTVFLGTWCGDSRREVPRLWKALDAAGGSVPFHIRYVGVDRAKAEPAAEVQAGGIHFVPTLIVARNGQEVGRIVEEPPHGVEADLLALLSGRAHGVVSASHPDQPR